MARDCLTPLGCPGTWFLGAVFGYGNVKGQRSSSRITTRGNPPETEVVSAVVGSATLLRREPWMWMNNISDRDLEHHDTSL
jgi:hypothetical protein